jgi:predicted dehydrogenase
MEPVRVVVSGPGLIGRKHIAVLRNNSSTSLVGIVAPTTDKNLAFAANEGVQLYASLESALDKQSVDGVIISSPNAFHLEQALTSIAWGIPTLVEKPLATSITDASAIMEASQENHIPVLVGHHRTYSPLLQVAEKFVSSNEFGRPVSVQGSALFYKPDDYYAAGPWRTREGGGPILINLIHEVGIMRLLFGEIESVSAICSQSTRRFDVEDTAGIVFSFLNGAVGTFLLSDASASSKSWEMTAGENPAYPYFPDQNCYHFAGSVGSLDFPTMRFRTYRGKPHASWWDSFNEGRMAAERIDPLAIQIDHFVDVIRGRSTPLVSAKDGYLNMVVIAAIKKAAKTGQIVRISDVVI